MGICGRHSGALGMLDSWGIVMSAGETRSLAMQRVLFGIYALLIAWTALATSRTFHALLVIGFCSIVIIRLICRGKRWFGLRNILGFYGFALLGVMAWKDHREIISAVLGVISISWGTIGVARLVRGDNERLS